MPRDPNAAKAHWDANMEIHFCMTFVEWKRSGEWNPNVSSEANWMKLAAHLNSQWGKQYTWSVYHSKFEREKRIWRAFAKLKGLRQSAEIGIGWDENRRCFLAEESQWNNLYLVFFPFDLVIHFQLFKWCFAYPNSICHFLVMSFSCFLAVKMYHFPA